MAMEQMRTEAHMEVTAVATEETVTATQATMEIIATIVHTQVLRPLRRQVQLLPLHRHRIIKISGQLIMQPIRVQIHMPLTVATKRICNIISNTIMVNSNRVKIKVKMDRLHHHLQQIILAVQFLLHQVVVVGTVMATDITLCLLRQECNFPPLGGLINTHLFSSGVEVPRLWSGIMLDWFPNGEHLSYCEDAFVWAGMLGTSILREC